MPCWRNRQREIWREHQKNLSMSILFTIPTVVNFPQTSNRRMPIIFSFFYHTRTAFHLALFHSTALLFCYVFAFVHLCIKRTFGGQFLVGFLSLMTYSVPPKTAHHNVGYNVLQFSGTFFRFDYKLLPYM